MAEPQTTVMAAVVAAVAPLAGQYAVIVFAALAGSLWALSAAQTATRLDGAKLLLRLVLTAAVLTGFVAWALEAKTGFPASKAVAPVAFFIGMFGDRWAEVREAIVRRVVAVIGGGQ
jgi:hypothetical protein